MGLKKSLSRFSTFEYRSNDILRQLDCINTEGFINIHGKEYKQLIFHVSSGSIEVETRTNGHAGMDKIRI